MTGPLLEVRALSYGNPSGQVLARDLHFKIEPNTVLYVAGPNGAGKSSLLRVLLGQQLPFSGSVVWHIHRTRLSYIPQLQNTAFHLPVTLGDVLRIASSEPWEKEQALRWKLLSQSQLDLSWNSASGGERKRTLLTRALMNHSALLILDEPMNHLDKESRSLIQEALESCPAAMIIVSHEARPKETSGKAIQFLELLGVNNG